jgi:hypothetical protein
MYPMLPLVFAQVSGLIVGDGDESTEIEFAQESKHLILRALLAEEWQESHGLLVVAAREPSAYHGGNRLKRKWHHARKLRRHWGHTPEALLPFICGMSGPKRKPGSAPVDDVVTFTQSPPAVVQGAVTLKEVAAASRIVRLVSRARALDMIKALWLHVFGYFRMLCAPHTICISHARIIAVVVILCTLHQQSLRGPLIPKAFQTRLRVMLVMGIASSLCPSSTTASTG